MYLRIFDSVGEYINVNAMVSDERRNGRSPLVEFTLKPRGSKQIRRG